MKLFPLAKAILFATLFVLSAHNTPAQTDRQLADMHQLTEQDWTDTLDYGEWLLNAQFWFDHSDSPYAKEFFADLHLTPADDAAFRNIVRDFTKRHDELLAASYAKLNAPDWTPEAQTKLVKDLVDATNAAIQQIQSNLSPDGASNVRTTALGSDPHS